MIATVPPNLRLRQSFRSYRSQRTVLLCAGKVPCNVCTEYEFVIDSWSLLMTLLDLVFNEQRQFSISERQSTVKRICIYRHRCICSMGKKSQQWRWRLLVICLGMYQETIVVVSKLVMQKPLKQMFPCKLISLIQVTLTFSLTSRQQEK